jgi:hypothetical protein
MVKKKPISGNGAVLSLGGKERGSTLVGLGKRLACVCASVIEADPFSEMGNAKNVCHIYVPFCSEWKPYLLLLNTHKIFMGQRKPSYIILR